MPDIQAPNALAQYAQIQQIQGGQQAQELARFQLGAAKRAESVQNALAGAYASSINEKGEVDYNKLLPSLAQRGGGAQIPGILKTRAEAEAAKLTQEKTRSEIDKNTFDLQDKKLKAAWNVIGSSTSPQKAIAEFNKGVKSGVFKVEEVAEDLQLLASMTKPEEFNAYLNDAIAKTLDAKGKLEQRAVTTKDTDRGGYIERQTYNAQGFPIGKPTRLDKTATIGETTAQKQLGVSQGQLSLAQQKFAFERANPGFELKEDADGNFFGVNKRTLQAIPVMVGGAAPAAAPAAPGAGMPGPRMPAPATQAIPGMTSVLDQPAAAAPVTGTPLRGKGTALTESQGNATAYGLRMREANAILEPLEKAGKTNTGLIKGVVGGTVGLIPLLGDKLEDVSGSVFNALPQVLGGLSPDQQKVAQARINFITAILRKESGAAIGRDEFATAEKNYFPKPGDDAAAIAQKQQARKTAIRAMEIQAGPGARQMGGGGVIPGASANNPLGLPGL
jgi:YD repeat-containing protein